MRSLLQDGSAWPYDYMLDVLSCDVDTRAFGPVRHNVTERSHDVGSQTDRAPARREQVLVGDMLGAD